MATFLEGIASTLPDRPKAIVVVSGHWEESAFTAGAASDPALIYDYYGFPAHTYELTYSAPGAPDLAEKIARLLANAGLPARADLSRGLDHGVFIPLKLVFPDATIPVVPLSLRSDYDAAAHVAAGRALAPLRDESVLIIGSGMSFHNMAGFRDPDFMARAPGYAAAFTDWLNSATTAVPAQREQMLGNWESAPAARLAHPSRAEEHLLPLMVAAGAGGDDAGTCIFDHGEMGMRIAGYRFG